MGTEIELKFRSTPEVHRQIEARFGGFSPISMETTYYDTPNGSLSARRITLRKRLENGNAVCTLKTPGEGLSRGEWEVEEKEISLAVPVLCLLSGISDLLLWTAEGLEAVCGARFMRREVILTLPDCVVQLALDEGVLLGGGKELPLCELEVELRQGSQDAAFAFARDLAEDYALLPQPDSKFYRAQSLATGDTYGI